MATLVLTSSRVDALRSGYDLRVAQLCALIPDELHLMVAPLYPLPPRTPTIDTSGLFAGVTECPAILGDRLSPRRHLRLDNHRYLSRGRPRGFAEARSTLATVITRGDIDRIVVFGWEIAELVAGVDCPKVLDICDSAALTQRRALAHAGWSLRGALELYRVRRTEARLPALFDQVTTVSAVDSAHLVALSGRPGNVSTVPNGVADAYLAPMPPPGDRRGVVFWGNLDFAPNADALSYFFAEVWYPALRAARVHVEVIGGNAPAWLQELARREPLVRLSGFVSDLRAAVTRYPVMVNPMRTGSGLKNKVLEAFGLGVVVVSTPRGVEALPAAKHGEHLVISADSAGFAAAVLDLLDDPGRRERLRSNANALLHERYRWPVTTRPWCALFDTAVGSRGG